MTEFQMQVPIGNLPVNLVLVGNRTYGRVAFVKIRPVGLVLENAHQDKEVAAMFSDEDFCFSNTDMQTEVFEYDTIYDYKSIPMMLTWLKQQNLQEPKAIFG